MATSSVTLHQSEIVGIGVCASLLTEINHHNVPSSLEDEIRKSASSAGKITAMICEEGGFDPSSGEYGICVLAIGDEAISAIWNFVQLAEQMQSQPLPEGFTESDIWHAAISAFDNNELPQAMYSMFLLLGRDFVLARAEDVRSALGKPETPITIMLAAHAKVEGSTEEGHDLCCGLPAVRMVPTDMVTSPKVASEPDTATRKSQYVPEGHAIN